MDTMLRHLRISCLLGICSLLPLAAAESAWCEGETPVVQPALLAQPDFPKDAVSMGSWGRPDLLSQGQALLLNITEEVATAQVPEEGLTFAYDVAVAVAGKQEIWGRVGYERVRSPMRWRLAGGTWSDLPTAQPTTDVVPLRAWNEVGWLRFGEAELAAGKVRIEINWPRTGKVEKPAKAVKGKGKPKDAAKPAEPEVPAAEAEAKAARILGALDALCIAPAGVFRPSGAWKPGEDHRSDADRTAEAQLFRLPEAQGAERSAVALTGAWQMANWDEDVDPADRLGPVRELPDLAKLRWFAYQVPGDRSAQRPDFAYHHRFIARCRTEVPAALAGRSFFLDIQRFNTIASVLVNGTYCGFSKEHSTACQIDISKAVKPGAVNDIVVVIKDKVYGMNPGSEPGGWRGFWNLPAEHLRTNQGAVGRLELAVASDGQAGLTEPVTLVAAGAAYASDVFVKTSVARKELALEVMLANSGAARTVTLSCAAVPWSADGAAGQPAKTMKPVEVALAAGESKVVQLAESWPDAKLWWPDDVHLYQLVATVGEGGKALDVSRTRFGFREWTWDSHLFRLNGVKWQSWADLTSSSDLPDFLAKRAQSGCNMIRLWSNGGRSGLTRRQFLDACDEQGVLVRNSGTFDGQVCNYGTGLVEKGAAAKERQPKRVLFDNWKAQLAAWVKAERNHASVFIWSVENEITYINVNNLGMTKEVEPEISDAIRNVVMKIDPTRPGMVDGGNCLVDESLPVNGAHYTELYASHWRDLPDASYTRDQWYDPGHLQRNKWRFVPERPIMKGEVFFANGYGTESMATIGGERCFIGVGETKQGRGLLGRVFSEGWRWGEVASWHFWLGDCGQYGYYQAWQPVAVLCRQWDTTFGAGQTVRRTLKVFNNTSSGAPITASWELLLGGAKVAGGSREFTLAAGVDQEWPIEFALPAGTGLATGEFVIAATRGGSQVYQDRRAIRVLGPAVLPKPALVAGELAVFDPQGAVLAFLKAQGIACTATKAIDDIPASARVLVVGPDAIPAARSGDPLWYSRALAGLRVLVLDQRHPLRYRAIPADLEPLDDEPSYWAVLRAREAKVEPELRGRYGFAEDLGHPAMAGLAQSDFFTWTGDHVVYRNPYRKGSSGFRSLFQCEKGLTCTALAECQTGEGLMLLSQFAIGEHLAGSAVAQRLLVNLIGHAATYAPVRREIRAVVPATSPSAGMLKAVAVRHQVVGDVAAALASDGIALVDATPANLAALAARDAAVRAWCAKGNWLMLMGVTPEGLGDFNKLVQWHHVLRPFEAERVVLATPPDPLTAGLTLRDVVLDTGKNMYGWMALKRPDADEFSWIVDHTDIAPFCVFPKPTEMGKTSDDDPGADHWPRNLVNGFSSDDNWAFTYATLLDEGQRTKMTLTLPQAEEIVALRIRPGKNYHPITRMNFYFDGDPTPVAADIMPESVEQDIPISARKARTVTLEIAAWAERGTRNVVVIDNLWLMVKRPDDYLQRVKPLLNIGGLMRYDFGRGGIVLNQLKLLENEVNPVNVEKKRTICKTLLGNLGAMFAGERTVVAGTQLKYAPVRIPDQQFNAYVRTDKQPAWWKGPGDMTGLPVGEQTFAGVRFLLSDFSTSPVPTAFMLRGFESGVKADRIDGIAVKAKADALFFLHTGHANPKMIDLSAAVVEGALEEKGRKRDLSRNDPNPLMLTYRIRFADGQAVEVPVRWGKEIANWVATAPASLSGASVAWSAPFAGTKAGEQAVVYAMQWTNPRPEAEIASVDLAAGDAKWGSVAVFAITTATVAK